MQAQDQQSQSLIAKAQALSTKRLMALSGLLTVMLALLFFGKIQEEGAARQTETWLRVEQAAGDCAAAANVAIMTGDPLRQVLSTCRPAGSVAIFRLAADGSIITATGATNRNALARGDVQALQLSTRGAQVLALSSGKSTVSWRPLDNGEALLVAAPATDIYGRTPAWAFYLLVLAAVSTACASLMAAFVRQSRAAASAAGAVDTLKTLNAALAGGRTGVWRFDSKTRTVHISRALLEPIGLGARDRSFSMREITALVHPEDLRAALAIITGDTSGVCEGVVRFREPAGGWSRTYFRTAPDATRFNRNGVGFDLSGARTLAAGAALAEGRLKDAIENIPEAFVLWDAHDRLAVWNRRFASITRLDPRELHPGMTAENIAAIAPVAGDIVTRYFSPESALDEQSVEVELPKDRWLNISRRRTSEGGLVCIASNVTDMKRRARAQKKKERELEATVSDLEESRRDLSQTMQNYQLEKHRAEEASRSKSEFLANMSHELRTPLNAINGFSEIMQSELYGPLGDTKYKEYISDILSSGQHLLELIDDILDMSRIEAGKLQLEPRRIEMERILEEATRLVAKRAKDAGVTLTVSVAHAPAVWADARAVKQVALNLLSNAIKFTPDGGEVTLTAEADLDGVTVIVADNGIGIAKENMDRLGAPFEMIEDHFAKSRSGSGLGLALTRSLMEMQGGILALASQPGRGTVACATFARRKDARVRLPQFIRNEAFVLTAEHQRSQASPVSPTRTEAAE